MPLLSKPTRLLLILQGTVHGSANLLWRDDFSGTSLNQGNWSHDLGAGGWGNSELQTYTTDAISVSGGLLVIRAARQGTMLTSGRIKTDGKLRFQYGTVEARIKIPDVDEGLWPGFWTLGDNFDVVGWPRAGEIDIMEVGQGLAITENVVNRRVISGAHWEHGDNLAAYATWKTFNVDLNDDFHIYKLEWTPHSLSTYVDNVKVWEMDISSANCADCEEFHRPHFLLLNLAVGGYFTSLGGSDSSSAAGSSGCSSSSSAADSSSQGCGQPRINVSAPLPADMQVDWIQILDNGFSQVLPNANPASTPSPTNPQVGPLSTKSPTKRPTKNPTTAVSQKTPTPRPTYGISTKSPTRRPTGGGSSTKTPTNRPSGGGISSKAPTKHPTSPVIPSSEPSLGPSIANASEEPSVTLSQSPSTRPSSNPSQNPTGVTPQPSSIPSTWPSSNPSSIPSARSSSNPSQTPSASAFPSVTSSQLPSTRPSSNPSQIPTPTVATPVTSAQPSQNPTIISACNTQNSPITYRSPHCDTGSQTGYQICMEFLNMPCTDVAVFNQAIAFWESIVTNDLTDHVIPSQFLNDPAFCGPGYNPPTPIDDLYICGSFDTIDGSGGVLGTGSSVNDGSGIPKPILWGIVKLDSADQTRMQNDPSLYYDIVLHEIGHVLGIGNNWRLANAPLVNNACQYTGTAATAAYRALSLCTTAFPPVECTNGHWSEACFDAELMTPNRNFGGILISELSVATLEDMGYTTDRNAFAYNFRLPDLDQSCRCNRRNLRPGVAGLSGGRGTDASIVFPQERVVNRRLHKTATSEMIKVAWTFAPPVNPIVPAGSSPVSIGTASTVLFWLLEDDQFYEVSVW